MKYIDHDRAGQPMHENDPEGTAARRNELFALKIGPTNTGVMAVFGAGGSRAIPFSHIERTPATERLMQAHIASFPEGLDVETQWVLIKDVDAEEVFTMVLIVEFPGLNESFTLFYPLSEYAEWLKFAIDGAGMGMIFTGDDPMDMLFCDADPDVLAVAIAAYEGGK